MALIIPNDRTQKQPVACICRNPECLESSDKPHFEFTTDKTPITCPKCGANQSPMVGLLALVHFLVRDKKGPIVGMGGLRFALACSATRAHLATNTNQEAATGDFASVNCPGCLTAAVEKKLVPLNGWALEQPTFDEKV
jgi:ribosomal protein S27E